MAWAVCIPVDAASNLGPKLNLLFFLFSFFLFLLLLVLDQTLHLLLLFLLLGLDLAPNLTHVI